MHPASDGFTPSALLFFFFFFKVGWWGNARQGGKQLCEVFFEEREWGRKKKAGNTLEAEESADGLIRLTKETFKLLESSGVFAGAHASTLRRRRKLPAEEKRRSEKKRSELDLFSKCSHILGSTFACPCQKRVGRGGMREVEGERTDCFSFFSPPSLPSSSASFLPAAE